MNAFSRLTQILAFGLLAFAVPQSFAECTTCGGSWVFQQSTYSHDPASGARVAQYMRGPAVEPLEDPRLVTSRYNRKRSVLRGADGSVDTTYEVRSWGSGRGGIDAEWERFHDAWKESYSAGGYYNNYNGGQYGNSGPYGNAGPYGNGGYGYPGYGNPGYGHGGPPWGHQGPYGPYPQQPGPFQP